MKVSTWAMAMCAIALLVLPSAALSANPLLNPGFEDAQAGDPAVPLDWFSFGTNTHMRDTSMPRTGAASALVGGGSDTSGFDGFYEKIDVTEDLEYTFSIWGRVDSLPITSDRADPMRIRIEWHSDPSSSSEISRDELNLTPDLMTEYQLFSISGFAPPGSMHARPVIAHSHSPQLLFADDTTFDDNNSTVNLGDVNLDGDVNGLDVDPFVDVLLNGPYQVEADMNEDADVNGLDVDPFVAAVVGGAGVQAVPEPSSVGLVLIGAIVGLLAGRRRLVRHRGGRAAANQTEAAGTESVTCDPQGSGLPI